MVQTPTLDILYSGTGDDIVLGDPATHDDVAEIFYNDRHTVPQDIERALATARLFANADRLRSSLTQLLAVAGTPITDRQEVIFAEARAVLADIESPSL